MKINNLISDIDKEIAYHTKSVKNLQTKKDKFNKILQQYPNASFDKGSIFLPGIWPLISCMSFHYSSTYRSSEIYLKFMQPERFRIEGMRICALVPSTKIAEISYNFQTQPRIHMIKIFDFRSIISQECPRRKQFIKRCRQHILDRISWSRMQIDPSSFEKEEFENFLLLR